MIVLRICWISYKRNSTFCLFIIVAKSYCFSVTKLCLTLCDPIDCSTPGFPVLHHLPAFVQTHVHWVYEAIHTLGSLFLTEGKFFTIFTIIFANQSNMIQSTCIYCDGIKTDFSLVTMKVAQSRLTLCNPMDYTVHGILQAYRFIE